ncbi:MAG: hydroxymethylbilane synthase [Rhizobiales bacterium]|nr:hydroxymethylbilane synthase [Hyphomicrobiales bacterium]
MVERNAQQVRIGTRGSVLALVQANAVRDALIATGAIGPEAVEIVEIKTTGDRILDRALKAVGGKGLFTKEIEQALLDRHIDIAVHSMKDMATQPPETLSIAAMLPREDVRDAFVSPLARSLADLPPGARLGTASLRRQAQVLRRRPDLEVVMFRGNVQTRLAKLERREADATLLAIAGLRRLGAEAHAASVLSVEEMLPAVAQGAIGVQVRTDDQFTAGLVAPLDHAPTSAAVAVERRFLAGLDGSCHTPIAGLAVIEGGEVVLRGEILSPDGRQHYAVERRGPLADGLALADAAADHLRIAAGSAFFEALRS